MGLKEVDDRRIVEVVNHALTNGDVSAVDAFGITAESLARYKREFRTRFGDFDRRAVLEKIASNYTTDELKAIAAGSLGGFGSKKHVVTREGEVVKFGFMTDTHIGSIYFREEFFTEALKTMDGEGCSFICHSGDVTDGLSNRPDHIYQLSHIGFKRQKDYAIDVMSMWDRPWYVIGGNHDCLSIDTEVLTDSGWKTVFQLEEGDKALSYDIDTDTCNFEPIQKVFIHDYNGVMVDTESKGHSSFVTENHRMLLQHKTTKNHEPITKEHEYMLAKDMRGTVRFTCAANSENSKYNIDYDTLRLVGWLLTDSNLSKTGYFTIYQSKIENITHIEDILLSCGIRYKKHVRDRDIKQVCGKVLKKKPLPACEFRLKESDVMDVIHDILPERKIQPWMYKLSDKQFDILFDEVIRADGTNVRGSDTAFALYKDYDFLSSFQGLCVMHGYRAYLSCNNRGHYVLNICKLKTSDVVIRTRSRKVKYNGMVWCLSMPKTNFMVRRNGKCHFTGNCWYEKSSGANIVDDISKELPQAFYLGDHEGDLIIDDIVVKLWHGNDASSYSSSYRLQKLAESFTGGDKPHVLLAGHTHKHGYFMDRNIHIVSGGALSLQSKWMRSKRLANHCGYWIITMYCTDDGVTRFIPEWYPFF